MARILVVEDELLVRELTAEDLEAAGHEVVCAASGDEALERLRSDTGFELLFTDIRMPGSTDGWELARQARKMIPGLAVIYATGYGDAPRDLAANELCLSKPYLFEMVLAAMAKLGLHQRS
jgi:CheY-like chemotaxis protein